MTCSCQKDNMSTRKVLYAIFSSCDGIAIQASVQEGKNVTGHYYHYALLKKLKDITRNIIQ